jgi:DNA-binding transcriptional ArsR family regulator
MPAFMKNAEEFVWCAERLKALADPDRLRIVTVLLSGPRHVGTLAEELNESIVKVSHHLGVLRHSGLVQTEKQGRFVEYTLHPDVFLVVDDASDRCLDLGCCSLDLPAAGDERRRKR